MEKHEIDFVFDGEPGPDGPRFIEAENCHGESVSVGRWLQRSDGRWVLRVPFKRHFHVAGTISGKDIDECDVCGHDIRHDIHSMRIFERRSA